MDKIFNYIRTNREQAMTLSTILTAIGLSFGLSISIYNSVVIGNILLMGIFPIGVFTLIFEYNIKFYGNPIILLRRCIILMIIIMASLCIEVIIVGKYSKYPLGIITFLILCTGLDFIKNGGKIVEEKVIKLSGANMDIDLMSSGKVDWKQSICPWNEKENLNSHKCAVKDTSICEYFCGIDYLDTVICCFPNENPNRQG